MGIVDFRLRPPAKALLDMRFYQQDRIKEWAAKLGVPPSPAALNRSMDAFWSEVDAAGVGLGVMNGRQGPDGIGSVSNDDIAELQRKFEGRLVGLGGARLGRTDTLREVDRSIDELGLRGISLDPGFNEPPLFASDPAVCEVAKRCGQLGVPLLITVSGLTGPDLAYGDPVHVDRLASACPETTIVVGHGCWPFVQEICGVAFKHPNIHVSPDLFMTRLPGVSDWVAAINTFLADRFIFGSGYPMGPLQALIDFYRELPLRDGVLERVMEGNARRVLGLA